MAIKSVLTLALFLLLIIASAFFLPITYALLAAICLIVLFILIDAAGNRILFRMSLRNVVRRKSTTALVIGGLMVGTAIISATLVVSDTLDNLIVGETAKGYGEVDFMVASQDLSSQTLFINQTEVQGVQKEVLGLQYVDAADWLVQSSASINNLNSNLSIPSTNVLGTTESFVREFGGFTALNGTRISSLPINGSCYVNERLAGVLNTKDGDSIVLVSQGIVLPLKVQSVVRSDQLGGFESDRFVFIDLPSAQYLDNEMGGVNRLAVSLSDQGRSNVQEVRTSLNETIASYPSYSLTIIGDRAQAIDDGRENVAFFTSMFFVFGSFSVIAGIALIVNIFTMLGEERKGEMGTARAVGMRRTHLRKLFTYEGMMYAAIAAAVGTGAGLFLAYGLINSAGSLQLFGDIAISGYFTFSPFSLTAAYLAGFILTLVTVYLTTRRISNMNIVRAIRNVPEPPKARDDKGLFRLGWGLVGLGALLLLVGIQSKSLPFAMSGLSTILLSTGLILRKWTGDRIAWNVAGLITFLIWLPKGTAIFPYESNIEMFVVSGVFMVTSALIIVMFNSDSIVYFFTRILRVKGGYKAVIKTAISYPLRAKVRTALSIFIFGLVIFTVTTLAMISGVLSAGVPQMVADTSGGFDVIAFSAFPVDMWKEINTTSGLVLKNNVTNMVQLSSSPALVTYTKMVNGAPQEAKFGYNVVGVDPSLYTTGHYPLTEWDKANYSTQGAAWEATLANDSLAILDGSVASGASSATNINFGSTPFGGLRVGDHFLITDNDGQNKTVTVIGFMKQGTFTGIFMNQGYVENHLQKVKGTNLFLIKLAGDLDSEKQSVLIQNQFWEYGVNTIAIKSLAQRAVSQIDSIFNLLRAYLGLGLIIGITGLGIITIRSIHERRIEIGMMRAIGYTKRMVVANFALESAFISVLGILIGSALGIIVGYQLWDEGFRTMGMDFVIAWKDIVLVGVAVFLITLLSVIPAARGASKVSPAEVLRFE